MLNLALAVGMNTTGMETDRVIHLGAVGIIPNSNIFVIFWISIYPNSRLNNAKKRRQPDYDNQCDENCCP